MKTEIVKLDDNRTYIINIPDSAVEGEIDLQDEIILELYNKLKGVTIGKGECGVSIKGIEYILPSPVFDLLMATCRERDVYKMITQG